MSSPAPPMPYEGDDAVVASGLTKRFGSTEALRGVDLVVPTGTICGLLGPNGAGKTTAVRILTTLLKPDGGSATVAGFDVATQPAEVRRRIGLAGQQAAVDELLTGRANLTMVGRLYHLPAATARRRADELLERFGLSDAATRIAKTYSGGMRRRLDLAVSLVASPPVLFLDEPTTGLDPRSRTELWEVLEGLVAGGTTLLLTTQYLEEADRLADDIVLIDHGSVIATGSPNELKAMVGGEQVEAVVRDRARIGDAAAAFERVAGASARTDPGEGRVSVAVTGGSTSLLAIVRELDASGIDVDDVGLRRPTLDEVFLRMTGGTAAAAPVEIGVA